MYVTRPCIVSTSQRLVSHVTRGSVIHNMAVTTKNFFNPRKQRLHVPLTSPGRGRGVRGFRCGSCHVAGFRVRDSTLTKLTHLVKRGTVAMYVIVTGQLVGRTGADCGGSVSNLVRGILREVWFPV